MPIALRNGAEVEDPLSVVLGFVEAGWTLDLSSPLAPASFKESDLRLANRYGARIAASEIATILERRRAIEPALRAIPLDATLTGRTSAVQWLQLRRLFDAFADIRGVGFSKMTKALHPKRPGLIPMLDSVVETYLQGDDLEAHVLFGERALELVRAYKRDLDRNRPAIRAVRRDLTRRGYLVTEVRILDLLIWSVSERTQSGRT